MVCEQSKWKEEPADHRQIWPISISRQHSLESGCALTTDIPWLPAEQFISKEHRSWKLFSFSLELCTLTGCTKSTCSRPPLTTVPTLKPFPS